MADMLYFLWFWKWYQIGTKMPFPQLFTLRNYLILHSQKTQPMTIQTLIIDIFSMDYGLGTFKCTNEHLTLDQVRFKTILLLEPRQESHQRHS